jgi:long-chain acyl-CoA synthetase
MLNHIGQIPAAAAQKFSDKVALVFEGKPFSFNEINLLVERAAGGLSDSSISPGDTVTLYASNSWEWIVSYYAIARLGAIINPVNTMLTPDEIEYVVKDCGAKAIIASQEKVAGIMGVKAVSDVNAIISFGSDIAEGAVSFDALIAAAIPAPAPIEVDPAALSTIGYTSGTTGHPKGAMQSH